MNRQSANEEEVPPYHAGRVALAGRPNVGKSTLLNAIVGTHLSIATPRPQTTRHRVLGIHTEAHGQIVFIDTPGLHRSERHAVNRIMNRTARGALEEVELIAMVVEAGHWRDEDNLVYEVIENFPVPRILAINKIDRIRAKTRLLPFIAEVTSSRSFAEVVPVSAGKRIGLDTLTQTLLRYLPLSPPLYPEGEITDRSERFLAGERIREQLMLQLGEELPYACSVEIERFTEDGALRRISAVIWVERENQKAIVIGRAGERLKRIARAAREAMEDLFQGKVFLEVWVKVRAGWPDNEAALRQFGYGE